MAAEQWVRTGEIDPNLPSFINAARTSTPIMRTRTMRPEDAIIKDASNWACAYAAESIATRRAAVECIESAYDVAKYKVGTTGDEWLMDAIANAINTFPSRI